LNDTEQFENETWLFQFKFKINYLDQSAISSITDYFDSYHQINLMSQIYVLAEAIQEKRLFEVYKKMFGMNLTISELCQFEGTNEERTLIKYTKQICERRNNLTGVHFRIGYRPGVGYLYAENDVIAIFYNFYFLRREKGALDFKNR
jgi:hypothetical protein